MVLAPIVRGRKAEYGKQFEELRAEGFGRVKVNGELRRLDEEIVLDKKYKHDIAVVVDRLVMKPDLRKRLADSIETAVSLADGLVEIEMVTRLRPDPHLLREVRLPGPRSQPGRARAADLLVQRPPRRLPAVHRSRVPDGDRPGSRRARSDAVDRRGRDRAVGGERVNYYDQLTQAIAERFDVDLDTPWQDLPPDSREFFLYGTNGERIQVSYRNRFGRRRSYATQFEASCRASSGATGRPTRTTRGRRSRST